MKVKASTYRDHVIVCGLGHLGYRVLVKLLAQGTQVVVIEKDEGNRFGAEEKKTGTPVLIRDMKDDEALVAAGVEHARVLVAATNDDMANLEAALDARRMNPTIRISLRMFDHQLALKFKAAFAFDAVFSSAALAAPQVAAAVIDRHGVAACAVAGVPTPAAALAST